MNLSLANIRSARSLQSAFDKSVQLRLVDAPSPPEKGKHLKTRVKEALTHTGHSALLAKITYCQRGALCSSVYCMTCHKRLTNHFEQALIGYVARSNLIDFQVRSRFRYATVICEVTTMSLDAVKSAMDRARLNMKAVHRSYGNLWYHGAFDLELIRPSMLGQHKADTVGEMVKNGLSMPLNADETYVLVHFHAVVDTGLYGVNHLKERFVSQFGQAPRQIRLDSLYQDQMLDESFAKISNYAYKHEWKFKSSLDPKEIGPIFYIPPSEMSFLISLYDHVKGHNGRGLVINCKSKIDTNDYRNDLRFLDMDYLNDST